MRKITNKNYKKGQVGNQTLFWVVFGIVAVGLILLLASGIYSPTTQPQAASYVGGDITFQCSRDSVSARDLESGLNSGEGVPISCKQVESVFSQYEFGEGFPEDTEWWRGDGAADESVEAWCNFKDPLPTDCKAAYDNWLLEGLGRSPMEFAITHPGCPVPPEESIIPVMPSSPGNLREGVPVYRQPTPTPTSDLCEQYPDLGECPSRPVCDVGITKVSVDGLVMCPNHPEFKELNLPTPPPDCPGTQTANYNTFLRDWSCS